MPGPQGYMPPSAHAHTHPAFPFMSPNAGGGGGGAVAGVGATHGQDSNFPLAVASPVAAATVDTPKVNVTDLWKGKTPGFCHPFSLLWAKNMGLCPDGMNPFHGVFDPELLMRSRQAQQQHQQHHHQQLAIEMKMPHQSNELDKNNRFSAFKPVGLFGNGNMFDSKLNTMVAHQHMMGSDSPDFSDSHSLGSGMSEVDDIDVNVTDVMEDVNQQTITRVVNQHSQENQPGSKVEPSPEQTTLREQNNNERNPSNASEGSKKGPTSDSASDPSCPGHMSCNTKNYSVEFLASTGTKQKVRAFAIQKIDVK